MNVKEQIEVLKRGIVEIISEEELIAKLNKGKPLRVKAGFDPTSPDLHLGHTVLLQKMKQFQELGHEVIFIIGDYTARIGDPSGRNETRPALTSEQIGKNVVTYKEQVYKILDRNKTQVVYNSSWLDKMSGADLIRLASKKTVSRMLERDDFEKRYKGGVPISIHEFLYPLLQGQDSVVLNSDVELGGTDQKFNLLVGRELQKEAGFESQVVITLPLLIGTDGVQKMGKSYGNAIGITESPKEMYGKLMSISDPLMWNYYELLSNLSIDQIKKLKEEVSSGTLHPMEAKKRLAHEITARLHSLSEADHAAAEFTQVFQTKKSPEDVDEVRVKTLSGEVVVASLLADLNLASSRSEARRLIQQHAVIIDEKPFSDWKGSIPAKGSYLIQVGKRRFKKVSFR
ncbi:MAG: tyrosine--tRNA ligase [Deltaproteobacteria bacterium]|nr:tyrosine--tRNA ligase [Deltaproteobacteria bacterium]